MEVAPRVAEEARQALMTSLPVEKRVSYKGSANPGSDVDKLVENQAIEDLHEEFPNNGFLAEESKTVITTSECTEIMDPLMRPRITFGLGSSHPVLSWCLRQEG